MCVVYIQQLLDATVIVLVGNRRLSLGAVRDEYSALCSPAVIGSPIQRHHCIALIAHKASPAGGCFMHRPSLLGQAIPDGGDNIYRGSPFLRF